MMRAFSVFVLVGALAACSSSGSGGGSKATTKPTTPTTTKLAFVLDDKGFTVPNGAFPAGSYEISFDDKRTGRPASEVATLQFGASGPMVPLIEIPDGAERLGTIYQNEIPWVTINGVRRSFPTHGEFSVSATTQFPTPVT
jgi:hypothetical protein